MKRILFLTPYTPSRRAGGENYTRQLLEHLSETNKVDLIYFRYSDDPKYEIPNDNVNVLRIIENSKFLKLKNVIAYPLCHPIFTVRFCRSLLSYIKGIIDKYDVLYLDHSQMFIYGKYFPAIPKILFSHDVMIQRYSRDKQLHGRKLVEYSEKKLMQIPNSKVFTFSVKDCEIIKKYYNVESKWTGFFIDNSVLESKATAIENQIVFFGKWKRPDNFEGVNWFFDNVYQKLNQSLKIVIIGNNLPNEFLHKISSLKNVDYLGFVDNPYEIIANSIATVAPLFTGAGVKVKVVESLACGTPVIGTSIAFEGISSEYDSFMLLADTPEQYVDAINNITLSKETRHKFKENFTKTYCNNSILEYINS